MEQKECGSSTCSQSPLPQHLSKSYSPPHSTGLLGRSHPLQRQLYHLCFFLQGLSTGLACKFMQQVAPAQYFDC